MFIQKTMTPKYCSKPFLSIKRQVSLAQGSAACVSLFWNNVRAAPFFGLKKNCCKICGWRQCITINDFEVGPHAISLLVAYILAFPIGWNREKEERSAGLRTFPLVAVASCGFIQGAEHLLGDEPEALARLIEGIITGVGFIGGGAILQQKNSVRGTATAASLWVTGAIGVSVGVGSYDVAIILSVMAFLTLQILSPFSRKLSPDGKQQKQEYATSEVAD